MSVLGEGENTLLYDDEKAEDAPTIFFHLLSESS